MAPRRLFRSNRHRIQSSYCYKNFLLTLTLGDQNLLNPHQTRQPPLSIPIITSSPPSPRWKSVAGSSAKLIPGFGKESHTCVGIVLTSCRLHETGSNDFGVHLLGLLLRLSNLRCWHRRISTTRLLGAAQSTSLRVIHHNECTFHVCGCFAICLFAGGFENEFPESKQNLAEPRSPSCCKVRHTRNRPKQCPVRSRQTKRNRKSLT